MRTLTTFLIGFALLAPSAGAVTPKKAPAKKSVKHRRTVAKARPKAKPKTRTAFRPRNAALIREIPVDPPDSATLVLPIDALAGSDLRDTFRSPRVGHVHRAIDIMQPRGTPVRAVADGFIAKLSDEGAGGTAIYQFDEQSEYCYYYAHLDAYAEGLEEQQTVRRGDVIGYVGSTGNAPATSPHLHFTIFKLGPEKQWWKGQAVNPYPVLKSLMDPEQPR